MNPMVNPTVATPETADALHRRKSTAAENKVVIGRFEINPTRPLNVFEHLYAEAFECINLDTGLNDHVAIVVKERYPSRKDVIAVGLGNEIAGLMILRAANVVLWAQDQKQRYVLIYRKPAGTPLLQRFVQRREALSEDVIRRDIIRPVFTALRAMSDRGLFHGNIRPDNIFLADKENTEVILGECASAAPGINQPVFYETIERGMADPGGRGLGLTSDDIYAFGVTVAVLVRGSNPMEGHTGPDIIEEKINRSSYAVLTDGLRLSPGLSEFLRGTLNDEAMQRWTINQLATWLDGNRISPKQSSVPLKAQRMLEFNGKKYIRCRLLAMDLHGNVPEAVSMIQSGMLSKWIKRSLGDQTMADQVSAAVSRAGSAGMGPGFEDRLLCFVSMALDPPAPIRYKNLKTMPGGIGYLLGFTMMTGQSFQEFGEILRERFVSVWMSHQDFIPPSQSSISHQFDVMAKTVSRRGLTNGMERCLYELAPDMPCLSDLLRECYVPDCEFLLYALDSIAEKHKGEKPLDRHIASFITVHDMHDNAGFLNLLEGSSEGTRRSLALLTLYQQLQKHYGIQKLENLCQWLSSEAEIIAQRFKNLALKKEIVKNIPKEAKTGSLTRLLLLVDNPQKVKKDEQVFVQAGQRHYAFGREREKIRYELETNKNFGFETGHQYALILSIVISVVIIVCTFVFNYSRSGM
ncbi:MAG: serine/threonine protein kinase [Alphaproteobacteria bacterium]|nr:serine/threonine protein kinase [Alphaproteobacteria bacterium]